jgi:hypothetical protein
MMAQLAEAPWIISEVPNGVIEEIVARSLKQNTGSYQYNYLPRIFYFPEEDFALWLSKDGHDHFF